MTEFEPVTEIVFLNPSHPKRADADALIKLGGIFTSSEIKSRVVGDNDSSPLFLTPDPKKPELPIEDRRTISYVVRKAPTPK